MITTDDEKEQKIAFSRRLRKLRRINDLSQQQAADALGVPLARYGNWEQERGVPSIAILPRIAALFNITIDELMGISPKEVEDSLITRLGNLNSEQREAFSNLLKTMFPENHK